MPLPRSRKTHKMKKKFKKVYVEVTNVCNLHCPFCHGTKRAPGRMSAEAFRQVMEKLDGVTEYVYYHLLGEPLLHPELGQMLGIAAEHGMKSCITTNGTLLAEKEDLLLKVPPLYRLSVSLHSFEANGGDGLYAYLEDVWRICRRLSARGTYCVLRLWNGGGAESLNGAIWDFLCEKAGTEPEVTARGYKLCDRMYLEKERKFDWPDENAPERSVRFCYGLRDQLGILCDGTVVPCCLDAEGVIALGNIFDSSVEEIVSSPRAEALYRGFSDGKPTEELCRRCGYASRF